MDGSLRGPGHIDSGEERAADRSVLKPYKKKWGRDQGVPREGRPREPQPSPSAPQRRAGA